MPAALDLGPGAAAGDAGAARGSTVGTAGAEGMTPGPVLHIRGSCRSRPIRRRPRRVGRADHQDAASGDLRVRETARRIAVVKGRTEQRLTQLYKGVPVFGGELTRTFEAGRTVGIAGALYADIDVDPVPTLTPADAAAIFDHLRPAAPAAAGRRS